MTGVEPVPSAWKAPMIPFHHTRVVGVEGLEPPILRSQSARGTAPPHPVQLSIPVPLQRRLAPVAVRAPRNLPASEHPARRVARRGRRDGGSCAKLSGSERGV